MKTCWCVALVLAAACSAEPDVETATAAVTGANGVWQNGLATNGVWQNGVWQNGVWQNGVWQNGVWQNGVWQNGVWQNGVWQNGVWQNGVWQNNLAARELLRTNPYAGKVLQYIYGCAMPAGTRKTLDAGDGVTLELEGAIGLAPQWDLEGGSCDESCQRWVSACVLARTNAYGVRVDISMRVSDTAPQHIKDALAVSPAEQAEFSLREGTFYGNIFQTTPVTPGDASLVANTPEYFACAGPGSNVPQLTKRFCSSVGDNGPIKVLGLCEPFEDETGVCAGLDDAEHGAERACYDGHGELRDEVITVYLRDPIATCGNSVCEDGETDQCPSDCHPGSWARTFAPVITEMYSANGVPIGAGQLAVSPVDDAIVVTGVAHYTTVDFGGGPLPVENRDHGVLVKYARTGAYLWGRRIGYDLLNTYLGGGVAVAADGTIVVAHNIGFTTGDKIWLAKYDASGAEVAGWPVVIGGGDVTVVGAPIAASDGSVIVNGYFTGTATFGTVTFADAGERDVFVAKVGADGAIAWAVSLGTPELDLVGGIALEPNGDVIAAMWGNSNRGLIALAGADGSILWEQTGSHNTVTTDAQGTIFAAGSLHGSYAFTGGHENDFFVAKYAADGTPLAHHTVPKLCPDGGMLCSGRYDATHIAIDAAGTVIVGSHGGGTKIDFGAGVFDPYATADGFVTGFAAEDLRFVWGTHTPYVLDGSTRGFALDSAGHVVQFGTFSGSMTIDDHLLVSTRPQLRYLPNNFLAAYKTPALDDATAPVVANTPDNLVAEATGTRAGVRGTEIFFTLPTATDTGYAGVNVACAPAPNTWFPVGTTPVTCTATDPLGNASTSAFTVTVRDTLGPILVGVPVEAPPAVAADQQGGAVVSYAMPTAIDQLDGDRPVTCAPASGSVFAPGTTMVVCSAADASGNETRLQFPVTVLDLSPPVLANVPASVTADASGVASYAPTATDVVDGDVTVTCTPPSGSAFTADTTVVCTAADASGNTAIATFVVHAAPTDTTPPQLVVPATPVIATATAAGTVVTYSASATDDVDGSVPALCAPASGSVFAPGTTTVTCTATDAAGNTASRSFPVYVRAEWSGVLQPINPAGTSVFKLGSTVPVKFQLVGASAGITTLQARLALVKLSSTVTGTEQEAVSAGQATTGDLFRYEDGLYIFNLATKPLSVGDWLLIIDFGDGASRTVKISLRK